MAPLYRNKSSVLSCIVLGMYIAALLCILVWNNIGYRGVWWDEAAQFWMSLGVHNFAAPFSSPAGLIEVVYYNNGANLDPGAFSILLHIWTLFGKSVPMLRSLPFLFLLVAMASLGVLAWHWTRDRWFVIGAMALPLCYPGITYFAFEVRAYSMEMAGIAVCTLIFARLLDRPRVFNALLLGTACAVFMGSRYSFFLFVLALGPAILLSSRFAGQRFDSAAWLRFALFAVLVVSAGTICYFVTMRYQLWAEMREGAIGLRAPLYTQGSTPAGSDDVGALIAGNLFSPAALPLTAIVVWLAFLRRIWRRRVAKRDAGEIVAMADRRFLPIYVMIVSVLVCSILASLLGVYPWDIGRRWSAYLLMLSAISVLAITAEIILCLPAAGRAHRKRGMLHSPAGSLAIAFMLCTILLATANSATYRRNIESTHRTNVALQLDRLPAGSLPAGSIFVAHFEIPILRYLYEYGPYSARAEYPTAFRFESKEEFQGGTEIDAAGEGLKYVISGWTGEQLSRRLRGYRLAPVGGTRLYRIVCPVQENDSDCD